MSTKLGAPLRVAHHSAVFALIAYDPDFSLMTLTCSSCKKQVCRYLTRLIADHPSSWEPAQRSLISHLAARPCLRDPFAYTDVYLLTQDAQEELARAGEA